MKKPVVFIIPALVIIITYFAFSGSLRNEFLNWDDHIQVVNNTDIDSLSLSSVPAFFKKSYIGMYQPLTTLSFAIDTAISGKKDAFGFHLGSLIIHLINILLLYILLLKFRLKPLQALIPLIFFAIHPLQVEPVVWVSARSTLLFTMFYIVALIFYTRFAENRNIRDVILTFMFFLLAVFSKPSAASFFLLIPIIEYYFFPKLTIRTFLRMLLFALPAAMILLVTYATRSDAGHLHTVSSTEYGFMQNFAFAIWSVVLYAVRIIFPMEQNPFFTYQEYSLLFLIIPLLIFAGIVYLIYRLKKYRQSIILCLGMFIVPLSVHLKWIPFGDQMIADRYTYLSITGLFLLPAFFLYPWLEKLKLLWGRVAVSGLALFIVALFGMQTVLFSETWQNNQVFWTKVIEQNPQHPIGYYNRGIAFRDKGRFREALADFSKVIELQPSNPDAWMARGTIYSKLGDFRNAVEDYSEVIRLQPGQFEAYFNRGNAYMNMEMFTDAIRDYNMVTQLNPDHADAAFSAILCMISLNYQTEEILSSLNVFIQRFPDVPDAYYFRGIIFSDNDRDQACSDFKKAAELGHEESKAIVVRACL